MGKSKKHDKKSKKKHKSHKRKQLRAIKREADSTEQSNLKTEQIDVDSNIEYSVKKHHKKRKRTTEVIQDGKHAKSARQEREDVSSSDSDENENVATTPSKRKKLIKKTEPTESSEEEEAKTPSKRKKLIKKTEPTESSEEEEAKTPSKRKKLIKKTEPTESSEEEEAQTPSKRKKLIKKTESTESSEEEEATTPSKRKKLIKKTESTESSEEEDEMEIHLQERTPKKKSGRQRLYEASNIDDVDAEAGVANKPYIVPEGMKVGGRVWGETNSAVVTGRFSIAEDQLLKKAVLQYCKENQLELEDVKGHFTQADRYTSAKSKRSSALMGMWKTVAEAFPARSVESVFRRGERLLHKGNFKGAWTEDELAKLIELVDRHGRAWVKIGNELGRLPTAVRDKYSVYLESQKFTKNKPWSKESDDKLLELVKRYHLDDIAAERNGLPKRGVLWGSISEKMNRPYHSCMKRYYGYLHSETLGIGSAAWGNKEDDALLQAIYDCGADEESEIPWDRLGLLCTARVAKSRWDSLKKRVPRFNTKPFDRIMKELDAQTRAKFEEEQQQEQEEAKAATEKKKDSEISRDEGVVDSGSKEKKRKKKKKKHTKA